VLLQCIPISTLLLALNVTHVDYFSLDVEGNEVDVLRTIDFDKFDITVYARPTQVEKIINLIFIFQTLSVEFKHVGEGKEAVREYMESKGYIVDSEVHAAGNWANDFIFVKNGQQSFS
jgi:hypothetical protein